MVKTFFSGIFRLEKIFLGSDCYPICSVYATEGRKPPILPIEQFSEFHYLGGMLLRTSLKIAANLGRPLRFPVMSSSLKAAILEYKEALYGFLFRLLQIPVQIRANGR